MSVSVSVCVWERVCERECERECVRESVRERVCVWESVWECERVCVSVCERVCERECERECVRESVRERVCVWESVWECERVCVSVCERVCERECVCVCVCVCVCERVCESVSLFCYLSFSFVYERTENINSLRKQKSLNLYGRLVLLIKYRFLYFILKTFLKTLFAFRRKIIFLFLSMLSVITILHYEKHKRLLLCPHNAREHPWQSAWTQDIWLKSHIWRL